jgi:hypothetical protein
MAKTPTEAAKTETTKTDAPKAEKPPKPQKISNVIVFRRTKKAIKEDTKLGPQKRGILMALESFGDRDVPRKELLTKLTADVLKTKQEPARILSFYQNGLVEDGWIVKKTVAADKVAA